MELYLLHILAFISVAMVATQAALPLELYWKSVLPNTPMPKSVRDFLHSDLIDEKSTSVGVGKGGISVSTQHKGKPVFVGVTPRPNPFDHQYAATESKIPDDPNAELFFPEKYLHPGKTMTLHFFPNLNTETFLPGKVADSIPFSSNKLPEIFDHFSVKPGSLEAEIMTDTIKECEKPGIKGEEKFCATSLESMIDFSTRKLGKNILAVSTEVEKQTHMQNYTITPGVKMMADDKAVACHRQSYAYAVFTCHSTQDTRFYTVPLQGADGTKVNAVAVCHKNVGVWNRKHVAFMMIKVKLGTVPVCHFLPQDHIVWVPK